MKQPVLDLFEEAPEAIIPSCGRCGATGDAVVVDGLAVHDLGAAVAWALIAISHHEREMHGIDHRAWCSGCGCLLGAPRDEKQFEHLAKACSGHLSACGGGASLTRDHEAVVTP